MGKFLTMYGIEVSINTSSSGSESYTELGEGIENMSEALNEVVYSGYWMSNEGFGNSEVTAMQPVVTMTGKRILGDAAQDYIFGLIYKLGEERKTSLKVTCLEATGSKTYTVPVTVANIQEYSGNTQDGSSISFELRFNGKPTTSA